MKLPAFWSRASAEGPDDRGGTVRFSCWRWSEVSLEDARRTALEAAQRIVRKLAAGEELDRYGYGPGAIREDVKQRFQDDRGELIAAITQNAYGSLVLNTVGAMFVDMDLAKPSAGAMLSYQIRKLFNRSVISPAEQIEAKALAAVDTFFETHTLWSGRLYRTHSGLRLLVTHAEFEPDGTAATEVFASLKADPLYIRLCRDQQCFRARLTPKPWRCGHRANEISWPRETDEQQRFDEWHQTYLDKQTGYATCRLIKTFGRGEVLPTIAPVVELHDGLTRCDEALPLA